MTKTEINTAVKEAVKSGNWMLRRSDKGKAYNEFQWEPIGIWTEAPDWNPEPVCGRGLHGCNHKAGGTWSEGKDVDFCETEGEQIVIGENKIKVRKARVLLRNILPDNLTVNGNLDLYDSKITVLPENLTVKGNLNLRNTKITVLPENLKVNGNLYLYGTNITVLPENLKVDGNLYLSGTNITVLSENLTVNCKR